MTPTSPLMSEQNSPDQVAYLGPEGTHSHAAVLKYFGVSLLCLPVNEITDVFRSVEKKESKYGVVPVENSSEGSINLTLDCFSNTNVKICGEVMLRIHHFFMLGANTDEAKVTKIVSHQQSLAQCREWLKDHYPDIERVSVSSNAEAARIAAEQNAVAAIASKTAAELYELNIVAEKIEDSSDNTTRFLVISSDHLSAPTAKDKTSIIIFTYDKAGALFAALEPFHRSGINMTRLESRPSKHATWAYSFYVDFEGHIDDQQVKTTLEEIGKHSVEVKVLGSYPVAS